MCVQNSLDAFSSWTGLKAIPARLPLCPGEDAVLLDVPSFSQVDTFSCGAIAAWSIVETFRPRANFWRFYQAVRPEPDDGVGLRRVLAALKKFGIGTRVRRRMGWKEIRAAIGDGHPMLIGTGKEDPDSQGDHWSTLVGYATHPRRVFLGNQPGLLRNRVCVDWAEFREEWWNPPAVAIICWGK